MKKKKKKTSEKGIIMTMFQLRISDKLRQLHIVTRYKQTTAIKMNKRRVKIMIIFQNHC